MFNQEFESVCNAAKSKVKLLKNNPAGYFISSMMSGIYVGIGIMLIFTAGGLLNAANSPATKIVMGISFGIALSLVVMAGAELFTGNNFIMSAASFSKQVKWIDTTKVWLFSFIGNLVGSILIGVMFFMTGLAKGPVGDFIVKTSAAKMSIGFGELFFRAVFCNLLVCVAIWCTFRCKSEVAKLIMIFWCLFAFITIGFEHSVANMTLLTIGVLVGSSSDVSISGYIYNIGVSTLGNMVGGILFIALPYYLISKNKQSN